MAEKLVLYMGGPPNHFGTKISEGTPQEPLQPKFPLHRSERPHFALFWFTYWELDPAVQLSADLCFLSQERFMEL